MDDAETWIDRQPEAAWPLLRALDARVRGILGQGRAAGGMLVYRPFRYRYATGREGDSAIVSIAVRKGGIAVYVNSVRPDGTYVAEAHARTLGKVKVGKACITVKKLEQLDLETFDLVVREAGERGGAGEIR